MKTKDVLDTYAQLAAGGYPKRSLNDSLTKIAADEGLTPPQVEYVASAANHIVWSRLFTMDKQASYNFPLADPVKVIETLNLAQASPAVHEADLDYMSSPSKSVKQASAASMSALVQFQTLDSDSTRRSLRHELQSRYEKVAQVQQDIRGEQIVLAHKIANLEVQFVKSARTLVMETPFSERPDAMVKIAKFMQGVGRAEYCRALLTKLSHVLSGQGLIKAADLKAPVEYISDKLPGEIINGRHPLYVTIRTLIDHYDLARDLETRRRLVDDTLPIMREKIREL